MPTHRVLVAIRVLEGESVPQSLFELLAPVPVVLLGYYVVPEQTPPSQASMQFRERAQAKLDELVEGAQTAGCSVETTLVFTREERQSVQRVADETDSTAFLLPNPVGDVESMLVSLRGPVDPARLADLVAAVAVPGDVDVTLFYPAVDDDDAADGSERLETARRTLDEAGADPERVKKEVPIVDNPLKAVGETAAEHDIVAMGERAPSLEAFFLGEDAERVAAQSLGPVLVLRRPTEE